MVEMNKFEVFHNILIKRNKMILELILISFLVMFLNNLLLSLIYLIQLLVHVDLFVVDLNFLIAH